MLVWRVASSGMRARVGRPRGERGALVARGRLGRDLLALPAELEPRERAVDLRQ